MQPKITKAVFPVAGLGTRFLPATKASPKEMLPVVDIPLIQYAVEEAVEAGIETLIFITGRNKRAIEDHFDKAYELETELEKAGKEHMLEIVRATVPEAECVFVRQREALGLGHAVHCAHPVIGDEAFAVLLADDMIHNEHNPVLRQMVEAYEKHPCSIVAVEEVPEDETQRYGIVSVEPFNDRLHKVNSIVEKPKPAEAPSNLAVVGRYILAPRVMRLLRETDPGAGGEIQLTDAIAKSLDYESVFAYQYEGTRYDCGSKLGYLMANVEMGLKHPEVSADFRRYLSRFGEDMEPPAQ